MTLNSHNGGTVPPTRPPSILVFGAGAIGSYLGAILAEDGADVTLLARGAHGEAMRATGGVTLADPDGRERHVPVRVQAAGAAGSRFDIVLVTLKSTQLAAAAQQMADAVAGGGALVMIQNGLPWWQMQAPGQLQPGPALRSLDPDGTLVRTIDPRTIVGAVIYQPCAILAPGKVLAGVYDSSRLVIGELDGARSERCATIAGIVTRAGLRTEVTADIRRAKWEKVIINLLWNPIAALTQCTPGELAAEARMKPVLARVLGESAAVAAATGVQLPVDIDAQLKRNEGNFTPSSMLQDVRAGKALELDAIVNAVVEIGKLKGVPVPTIETIAACASMLDRRMRAG